MFTGLVATVPMCFLIKSAITQFLFPFLMNPDMFEITSVQKIIRFLMYVSPHQALFDVYQVNYIRYSIFGLNYVPTLVLLIQLVGYSLIFFVSQSFFNFRKPSVDKTNLRDSDIDLSQQSL